MLPGHPPHPSDPHPHPHQGDARVWPRQSARSTDARSATPTCCGSRSSSTPSFYLQQNPESASRATTRSCTTSSGARSTARTRPRRSPPTPTSAATRDVAAAGINPLVHYLRIGQAEGRGSTRSRTTSRLVRESGLFDEDYYRHFHPDLPDGPRPRPPLPPLRGRAGPRPEREVLHLGLPAAERRRREERHRNPLVHYLRHGRAEGRIAPRGALREPYVDALYAERWQAHRADAGRPPRRRSSRAISVVTDSVAPAQPVRRRRHRDHPRRSCSPTGSATHPAPGDPHRRARRPGDLACSRRPPASASTGASSGVRPDRRRASALAVHRPRHRHDDVVVDDPRGARQHAPPRAGALPAAGGRADVLRLRRRAAAVQRDPRPSPTSRWSSTPQRLLDHLPAPGDYPHLAEERDRARPRPSPTRDASVVPAELGRRRSKQPVLLLAPAQRPQPVLARRHRCSPARSSSGLIDPEEWELHFVGRGTPDLTFPRDVKVNVIEGLGWTDYQASCASMDAALVLMDTPHPSYPPLRPRLGRRGRAHQLPRHQDRPLRHLRQHPRRAVDRRRAARGPARAGRARPRPRASARPTCAADHINRDWETTPRARRRLGVDRFRLRWRSAAPVRRRHRPGCSLTSPSLPASVADLWDSSMAERVGQMLDGEHRVAFVYRTPDTSTFRYRVANTSTRSTTTPRDACGRGGSATTSCARSPGSCPSSTRSCVARYPLNAALRELAADRRPRTASRCSSTATTSSSTSGFAELVMSSLGKDPDVNAEWDVWFAYMGRLNASLGRCRGASRPTRRSSPSRLAAYVAGRRGDRAQRAQPRPAGLLPRAARRQGWHRAIAPLRPGHRRLLQRHPVARARLHRRRARARPPARRATTTCRSGSSATSTTSAPLEPHRDRVEFQKFMHYVELQRSIAEVEVNIAPAVSTTAFNVCKSDLKFFEAAAVGTWTVASHTPSLDAAVDDGVTGRLARRPRVGRRAARGGRPRPRHRALRRHDVGRRRARPRAVGVGLGRDLGAAGRWTLSWRRGRRPRRSPRRRGPGRGGSAAPARPGPGRRAG